MHTKSAPETHSKATSCGFSLWARGGYVSGRTHIDLRPTTSSPAGVMEVSTSVGPVAAGVLQGIPTCAPVAAGHPLARQRGCSWCLSLQTHTHTHTRTLWRQTIHVVLAICISPPPPLQVFALAKVAFSRFASHTKRAKITQCPCPLVLWADPLPPSFVFSDCTRCRSNKRAVTAAYTKPRELQRSCGSGRRKVPVPPMCKYGLRVLKAKQAPSAGRSTGVRIVAPV